MVKSKEKLANRIGSLLIHVYGDVNKLTLSVYSYSMRVITSELSELFKFNTFGENKNNDHHNLQYLTPVAHKRLFKNYCSKL